MTDAPTDRAARAHSIEAEGSVLVQAPAGSGKTTLLAQRYLRLLALADTPERILALTFTRRAAQEMRERVLKALGAARFGHRPPNMNQETWNLAVAAARHLAALHLDIERQPSRLRIETIDAFNAWLASQLPIAAGAGSGVQVLADARPCYEEAARRALARDEDDRFSVAVDRVLALDDQRWRRLLALIADMLPSRDRWLPLLAGRLQAASALDEAELGRVRQHLDEDLQLLVARGRVPPRADPRARCSGRRENRRLVLSGAGCGAAFLRRGFGAVRMGRRRLDAAHGHAGSRQMAGRRAAAAHRRRPVSQETHQERGVPAAVRRQGADAGPVAGTRASAACTAAGRGDTHPARGGLRRR
jgi:hypothetical protein